MPHRSAARRVHLERLLADVVVARHREAHALTTGSPCTIDAARADTLLALTEYAAAIEALSWPVPRGIHLDIQMHRSLSSAR